MEKRCSLLVILLCIVSLGFNTSSYAQTTVCNGAWGPPIVNQDFGQGVPGTNFYGPLSTYAPGVTTSTNFLNNVIGFNFPDGDACLTTSPALAHGSDWLTIGDHTGNP